MDRQQIGMKLVLQGLELPLKLTTFDDRLVVVPKRPLFSGANP